MWNYRQNFNKNITKTTDTYNIIAQCFDKQMTKSDMFEINAGIFNRIAIFPSQFNVNQFKYQMKSCHQQSLK